MDAQPAQDKATNYQGETEIITDSGYITMLLRQLSDARCLLQVLVPGADQPYNSAVLDVSSEHHYLVLDELSPAQGHQQLLKEKRMTVSARLHGVDIRFACAVEQVGGQQGIAFYRATLPQRMYYRQRRSAYRIKLGLGMVVPVHFEPDDMQPLDGTLCDLSIGGIGARINTAEKIERGKILTGCEIKLSQGSSIQGEVEIRYASKTEQKNDRHIGARFVNLTRAQTAQLERFVKEVEREILRRNHKA